MRSDGFRWIGIGGALGAAVLTALVVAEWRPLVSLDESVARDLHRHAVAHPGITQSMRILSDWVWDPWTMRLLAAVACVVLWWRGDRGRAVRVAVATAVAALVQQGLKALVGRERPVWPDPVDSAHYSAYPSGHAMTATVVCGLLVWLLPRRTGRRTRWVAVAVAAVSAVGVGFTRLYLGVHWASDVVGGWLLGVTVVVLATAGSGQSRVPRRPTCPGRPSGPGGG
ncbi:phosphatase PAP2 family protein [Streptomyces sp. NPDC058662]|uniref:phosphatase PAP2 family protein n=1 Tax=Streptomyces sp. NPDC058662 TaxID=3346583 RepID=UPI00364CBED8